MDIEEPVDLIFDWLLLSLSAVFLRLLLSTLKITHCPLGPISISIVSACLFIQSRLQRMLPVILVVLYLMLITNFKTLVEK